LLTLFPYTTLFRSTFKGIAKAVAAKADYCNEAKTNRIKQALNRHLAGDYTPSPPEPAEQEDGILNFGSGSNSDEGVNTKQVFEN
jgi:hypothetical protein